MFSIIKIIIIIINFVCIFGTIIDFVEGGVKESLIISTLFLELIFEMVT